MWRVWAVHWLSRSPSSRSLGGRNRGYQPVVEDCEARRLLSGGAMGGTPLAVVRTDGGRAAANVVSKYRVFEATIRRGPHAGTTFEGPLVLGVTGRIQVFGFCYPEQGGPRVAVVGTVFGGAVALRFNLPGGGALEVSGSGRLQRVPRGIAGGLSLVGLGNVTGPARSDFGSWQTVAPSRAVAR